MFYVFSSSAAPFEPNQAYSPFTVYTLLEHNGDYASAASTLRSQGFGSDPPPATDVDISRLLVTNQLDESADETVDGERDPGPIPEALFHVPGFISRVMEFTLANAPYPNVGLAFCGAMALQSYLCGRKVCTPGDLRPNIYLLALAGSGTGKDFPRKVNARVLFEIGHDRLPWATSSPAARASRTPWSAPTPCCSRTTRWTACCGRSTSDRENHRESIPNILLTLYTSANDVYPIRVKAGQKEAIHIDQPHLTLFGTATPQYFYESLSQRMLTNGFFARLIIVDIGKRGAGQDAGSARHLPEAILDTARWWADYPAGPTPRQPAGRAPRAARRALRARGRRGHRPGSSE